MVTLGVVADTHIPDRIRALPAGTLAALAGVDAILHAGDVCVPRVLAELGRVAPVYAVAGNRDFLIRGLPRDRVLTFEGVRIGLTHGHGDLLAYARERLLYELFGYRWARYRRLVRARFAEVEVIVFGHTHRPVNTREDGVLYFNPGSLGPNYIQPHGAALGLLRIAAGQVEAEIVSVA